MDLDVGGGWPNGENEWKTLRTTANQAKGGFSKPEKINGLLNVVQLKLQ